MFELPAMNLYWKEEARMELLRRGVRGFVEDGRAVHEDAFAAHGACEVLHGLEFVAQHELPGVVRLRPGDSRLLLDERAVVGDVVAERLEHVR